MQQILFVCVAMLVAPLSLLGCSDDSKCGPGECSGPDGDLAVEVVGIYQNNFDMEEVITDASWSYMEIVSFDNDANVAITQNPSDDMFNPDKFNRVEWTEPGADGSFHYCTAAYGKDSAADAEAAEASVDAADLDGAGCNNFAWTKLTKK